MANLKIGKEIDFLWVATEGRARNDWLKKKKSQKEDFSSVKRPSFSVMPKYRVLPLGSQAKAGSAFERMVLGETRAPDGDPNGMVPLCPSNPYILRTHLPLPTPHSQRLQKEHFSRKANSRWLLLRIKGWTGVLTNTIQKGDSALPCHCPTLFPTLTPSPDIPGREEIFWNKEALSYPLSSQPCSHSGQAHCSPLSYSSRNKFCSKGLKGCLGFLEGLEQSFLLHLTKKTEGYFCYMPFKSLPHLHFDFKNGIK